MRQLFGDRRLNQICCAKFGQKMLRGRPDRIAKFYESIKPGYDSRRQGKGAIGFVRLNVRIDLRIDKESRAPTHFVSQQSYSGSRVIERLDHNVFQFVPQELLDSAFVFFLYFGVIGEQSYRSETAVRRRRIIRRIDAEQFLHRVGCVSSIAQNLLDRGTARSFRREAFAGHFKLLSGFALAIPKLHEPRLRILNCNAEFPGLPLRLLKFVFRRRNSLFQRGALLFDRPQRNTTLFFSGRVASGGFFGLQRFRLLARRFFHQPRR